MRTQLILKASDISNLGYTNANNTNPTERATDYAGTNGSINRRQSLMTWKNINLRDILGELYQDNCNYNLKLVNISFFVTSNLSTYTNNESDRCFNIFLSGLPNMKSYSSQGINQEALLSTVRVPTGAFSNSYNYDNNIISFKINNSQFCDLTITYRNLLTNAIAPISNSVTVDYPYAQFLFNIYKTD